MLNRKKFGDEAGFEPVNILTGASYCIIGPIKSMKSMQISETSWLFMMIQSEIKTAYLVKNKDRLSSVMSVVTLHYKQYQ